MKSSGPHRRQSVRSSPESGDNRCDQHRLVTSHAVHRPVGTGLRDCRDTESLRWGIEDDHLCRQRSKDGIQRDRKFQEVLQMMRTLQRGITEREIAFQRLFSRPPTVIDAGIRNDTPKTGFRRHVSRRLLEKCWKNEEPKDSHRELSALNTPGNPNRRRTITPLQKRLSSRRKRTANRCS